MPLSEASRILAAGTEIEKKTNAYNALAVLGPNIKINTWLRTWAQVEEPGGISAYCASSIMLEASLANPRRLHQTQ